MSTTTCKVFRPTDEEFQNFHNYIKMIEILHPDIGLCKVIPPSSWKVREYDIKALNFTVDTPSRQEVTGRQGVFNVDPFELKSMSLQEFYRKSKERAYKGDKDDFVEIERNFWRSILGGTSGFGDPVYGADIKGTLFDNSQLSHPSWNINELENLLNLIKIEIPGVNTPMIYVGSWRAMFAFHVEDMDLYSINYLHHGDPKSWYSVPPTHRKRFESLAESFFQDEYRGCHDFLRHKGKLFSPWKLKENWIPYETAIQFPGEFMVTFPGSYHAGYNHGFNIAEATNFATERWIDIGRHANRCCCRPYSVFINVEELETCYLRKKKRCQTNGTNLREILVKNPHALVKNREKPPVDDSFDYFRPEERFADHEDSYFDPQCERVRCLCSLKLLPPDYINSNEVENNNHHRNEPPADELEDRPVTNCQFCGLWFHKDCIREEVDETEIDIQYLLQDKCHICAAVEQSDVFDEKELLFGGSRKSRAGRPTNKRERPILSAEEELNEKKKKNRKSYLNRKRQELLKQQQQSTTNSSANKLSSSSPAIQISETPISFTSSDGISQFSYYFEEEQDEQDESEVPVDDLLLQEEIISESDSITVTQSMTTNKQQPIRASRSNSSLAVSSLPKMLFLK
jgi:jumonji domain-containing protein 2